MKELGMEFTDYDQSQCEDSPINWGFIIHHVLIQI